MSLQTAAADPVAPAAATHVLAWWPAFMLGDTATEEDGGWELLLRPDYDACHGGHWAPQLFTDSRDTEQATLEAAVTAELGYPVTLTPWERQIRRPGRLPRWSWEPIYYITPKGRSRKE